MKRFFFKVGFFIITGFVLTNALAAIYGHLFHSRFETPGGEVYEAIKKAQAPSSCAVLVLGDSVSHQLLMHRPLPGTLNLSTNQAISLYGQYVLARAALEHAPSIRQVILAYHAPSFDNNLQQKFTFNYVVKPFYSHPGFRDEMSPLVRQLLDRRPAYRLMVLPLFRYTSLLSSTDYSSSAGLDSYTYLSPVSVEYLRKLSELCQEKGVRLKIISTPISSQSGYDPALFAREIAAAHLEDIFTGFAESVRWVDPAELVDGVHFKPEFVKANSETFVQILNR